MPIKPTEWSKNSYPIPNEDDEIDPEWIEFDPEKVRSKFLGHVMEDESKIRENILKKKENKQTEKNQ